MVYGRGRITKCCTGPYRSSLSLLYKHETRTNGLTASISHFPLCRDYSCFKMDNNQGPIRRVFLAYDSGPDPKYGPAFRLTVFRGEPLVVL